MARFIRKYSEAEKDALMKAVFVDGITVAEAVRRAPQGRLDVPAFTLNLQYAYDIVKTGRDGYEERNPEALELATANELRRLHRLNLKRSRGLTEASDPDEIKRAAQALSATRSAMRGPGGSKPRAHGENQTNPTAPTEKPSQSEDVLSRLLREDKAPRTAKNEDVIQPTPPHTEAYTPPMAATNEAEHGEQHSDEGAGRFARN
jgi:hypothetical protein